MNITTINNYILDVMDYKSIVVMDLSDYNEDITPTNNYIEVWPPNFTNPTKFEYDPLTNTIVNSASLGWTATNCLANLQDGLWTFRQSTCPNDQIYLVKYHLRILNTQALIAKEMNNAIEQCDDKSLAKWYDMMKDLETAKYLAEHCNQLAKAKALFNSIAGRLTSCPTC